MLESIQTAGESAARWRVSYRVLVLVLGLYVLTTVIFTALLAPIGKIGFVASHWMLAVPRDNEPHDLVLVDHDRWDSDVEGLLSQYKEGTVLVELGRYDRGSAFGVLLQESRGIRVERLRSLEDDDWIRNSGLSRGRAPRIHAPFARFVERELLPDEWIPRDSGSTEDFNKLASWWWVRWYDTPRPTPGLWIVLGLGAISSAALFVPAAVLTWYFRNASRRVG